MKTTFAELGIPFPLYEAPVDAADDSDYAGLGSCCICGNSDTPTFHLGIGTAIIVPCPFCHSPNGLPTNEKRPVHCRACGVTVAFPPTVAEKKEPKACYACLRSGKAAVSKATEFGMVAEENAFSGVTNGIPGLKQDQFETVVLDPEDEWIGVRLPENILFELIRTPTYGTWQGECWLFCCRYPMTFIGEWGRKEFDQRAANDDGERLYYAVVEEAPPDTWNSLGYGLSSYLFECKKCGKLRAHFDSD